MRFKVIAKCEFYVCFMLSELIRSLNCSSLIFFSNLYEVKWHFNKYKSVYDIENRFMIWRFPIKLFRRPIRKLGWPNIYEVLFVMTQFIQQVQMIWYADWSHSCVTHCLCLTWRHVLIIFFSKPINSELLLVFAVFRKQPCSRETKYTSTLIRIKEVHFPGKLKTVTAVAALCIWGNT